MGGNRKTKRIALHNNMIAAITAATAPSPTKIEVSIR